MGSCPPCTQQAASQGQLHNVLGHLPGWSMAGGGRAGQHELVAPSPRACTRSPRVEPQAGAQPLTATEAIQDYNPQTSSHRLPAVYDFEYELESTRGRKRILSTGEGQRWLQAAVLGFTSTYPH